MRSSFRRRNISIIVGDMISQSRSFVAGFNACRHNASLWLTEKTGFTMAFFAFGGVALVAALMGFIFLL
jgi:hypothetical protein